MHCRDIKGHFVAYMGLCVCVLCATWEGGVAGIRGTFIAYMGCVLCTVCDMAWQVGLPVLGGIMAQLLSAERLLLTSSVQAAQQENSCLFVSARIWVVDRK